MKKKTQGWRDIYSEPPVMKIVAGALASPLYIMLFINFIYIMVAVGIISPHS